LKNPLYFATPPLKNDMSGLETATAIFCASATPELQIKIIIESRTRNIRPANFIW
jgi:hypothetical protein